MTKLFKKLWPLLFMPLLVSVQAYAENERGNGGGAFVCRNSNGKILSAELVDFYEGVTEYKLEINKSSTNDVDQLNRAILKYISVAKDQSSAFLDSVQKIQDIMNIVPNANIENTNDFNLSTAPKKCKGGSVKFEQLANYTDDDRLTVDKAIYEALPNTDKAGLIIHEAAYLLARKWHDAISSQEARRLNAHLFATIPSVNISRDILLMNLIDPNSNKKWICSALIVGAEFKKFVASEVPGGIICSYPECFVKNNIKKKTLSAYASNLFKAQDNLFKLVKETNLFSVQYSNHVYAHNYCGIDSGAEITDAINTWDWPDTSIDSKIDCNRTWSPNYDCKKI